MNNKLKLLIKNSIGGGLTRTIIISLFATLACVGIIKAATTIGNNITTGGTLDVTGASTFSTASSTGIVKFSEINSDTGVISFGNENLSTTGTLNITGLTTLGNASTTLLTVSGNAWLPTTIISSGNLGIGTSSPYAKLSVVGEAVASYFTATSTTATSNIAGKIKTGSMQISQKSYFPYVYGIMGISELFGLHDLSATDSGTCCSNVFYSEQKLTATSGSSTAVTNGYFQTRFEAPNGSETLNDVSAIFAGLSFTAQANYTISADLKGLDVYIGESGVSSGTQRINNLYGIKIWNTNESLDKATFNVDGIFADIYLGGLSAYSKGTTANRAGIWMEDMTFGTNRYGMVVDSDAVGVTLGADQDATIKYDGNNMQYNNMQLNDIGAKSVCSAWASITNPLICIGWLNHTGSGSETDLIGGYNFALNNISASEISAKSQVWTLNGAGGNEYLELADNDNFTFASGASDVAFSGAAWVEVVNASNGRSIISKRGALGQREWAFNFGTSEQLSLTLYDQTSVAGC